jgi:hypothetical protein
MHRLLKRPGYRLYPPDSLEAGALLAEHGLSPADLDHALAELERTEGTTVRSIVGINEDGVFGTSREGWRPDLPDAGHEPFIPLLWIRILELLGRVPEGSTARSVRDGHAAERCPASIPAPTGSPAESLDPETLTAPTPPHYAAAASRPAATSSKLRPSLSRVAVPPLNSCQRRMIVSTYFGSSSISRAWRPAFSHAISVDPDPPNGSNTMSRLLLELRIARSTRATGFMVGCRSLRTGLSKNQTSP